MHFLIIKQGALGDVVRTSYFAEALKRKYGETLRLSWITSRASLELLRLNPFIDDLWSDFSEAMPHQFSRIFSLDDELDTLECVGKLRAASITGATLKDGRPVYSNDSAAWFDMGLNSRFGKLRADELKKGNQRSHAEIFRNIFGVEVVAPKFYLDNACRQWAQTELPPADCRIGINPYAGGRWPSKELDSGELDCLIAQLLSHNSPFGESAAIVLLGAGEDLKRNKSLAAKYGVSNVLPLCTDGSVQRLAAAIGALDYLISSDSLALHLAIAQHVSFTAFFSPTSAVEIDDWGIGTKVISTASDYCSYRKDADNKTITADRLLDSVAKNPRLERLRGPKPRSDADRVE